MERSRFLSSIRSANRVTCCSYFLFGSFSVSTGCSVSHRLPRTVNGTSSTYFWHSDLLFTLALPVTRTLSRLLFLLNNEISDSVSTNKLDVNCLLRRWESSFWAHQPNNDSFWKKKAATFNFLFDKRFIQLETFAFEIWVNWKTGASAGTTGMEWINLNYGHVDAIPFPLSESENAFNSINCGKSCKREIESVAKRIISFRFWTRNGASWKRFLIWRVDSDRFAEFPDLMGCRLNSINFVLFLDFNFERIRPTRYWVLTNFALLFVVVWLLLVRIMAVCGSVGIEPRTSRLKT